MPQQPPLRRAAALGLDVELRTIHNDGRRFPAHWHHDLQVIASVRGDGEAVVEGRTVAVPQGALIVIPPRLVHTAFAVDAGGWTFLSLHAAPERVGFDWNREAGPMRADHDDVTSRHFRDVIDGLFEVRDLTRAVRAFERFLDGLRTTRSAEGVRRVPPVLLRARTTLSSDLSTPVSIALLARSIGYSTRHFSRMFRRAFFMTPQAWRLNERTEAAKIALRSGRSVAEAARIAGFASATQFSRHYRKRTGLTARAYRAQFNVPFG